VFSVDIWAKIKGLAIKNIEMIKLISTRLLRGEPVGFYSEYPYEGTLPENINEGDSKCGIYIGSDCEKSPFVISLCLSPKNFILGIGCKRGTPQQKIEEAVQYAGVKIDRVFKLCSIDIKANETGLLSFAEEYKLETEFFSAESLMQLPGEFTYSDYVRNVTGADNVCERAATRGGGEGELIIRKTALDGVTVAVFEKKFDLRFE
jgi:cobalt-precorrin 5A hydrolase